MILHCSTFLYPDLLLAFFDSHQYTTSLSSAQIIILNYYNPIHKLALWNFREKTSLFNANIAAYKDFLTRCLKNKKIFYAQMLRWSLCKELYYQIFISLFNSIGNLASKI